MVSPLGCSAHETWQRLLNGEQAGRMLTGEDIDHFEQLQKIAGLCINGAPVNHSDVQRQLAQSLIADRIPAELFSIWRSEPLIAMSLVAFDEALQQANLQTTLPRHRTAIVFGASKGGLRTAERLAQHMSSSKTSKTTCDGPFLDDDQFGLLWNQAFSTDSVTRVIAAVTGAQSSLTCPVAACATGLIAILQGAALVHAGHCDVCIVGSADAGLRASVLSSFHRLRVASRHQRASDACRPFDESRDGFLIGEGAGVLILESREHAQRRGADGLAQVSSGGWLSDPTGMTQIDTSGTIVAEVLKRSGCIGQQRPDVIGLHGTGTESNDLAEARGVQLATGWDSQPCFGVKGAIGHLLGAAGSVEAILSVLSLVHQITPGTTNLTLQDARCPIRLNASTVSRTPLERVSKLSLGFGGHVACGVFDKIR
jgi:3-oxoacyl-[acyl-carrier-protein] synthase II